MSNTHHKPKGPGGGQFDTKDGTHPLTGPNKVLGINTNNLGANAWKLARGPGWTKYRNLLRGKHK